LRVEATIARYVGVKALECIEYVQCNDCPQSWTDRYSLFTVDIDDPSPPIEEPENGTDR